MYLRDVIDDGLKEIARKRSERLKGQGIDLTTIEKKIFEEEKRQ